MEDGGKAPRSTGEEPFLLSGRRIDPQALCIEHAGCCRRVESKVMQVMLALARKAGRVVSRQDLLREVWDGRIVTDDALTNAVVKLRKALDDNPRKPKLVETIAKGGYRLKVEPVPVEWDDSGTRRPGFTAMRERLALRWWISVLLLAVLAIAIATLLSIWLPRGSAWPERDSKNAVSIAVIPFDVFDEAAAYNYLAEGIALDLITVLSRIPGLVVIAPESVFGYREASVDDQTIAGELGVQFLIRGGVQRDGDEVRINVRLLDAEHAQALWAERFVGKTDSLLQIQDEVAEGIVKALPMLGFSAQLPRSVAATESVSAYDEFLKGQERYGRLTPEDNRFARFHFEQAIELDPGFARAHASLALAWSRLAIDGWTDDPQRALSRAAEHAKRAAAIDPSIAQIHFVRAEVDLFRGRHNRAAAAATMAIALDPNYADAYALLAWILNYAGRPAQAAAALDEALALNPRSSASYREIAGEILFSKRRYVEAAKAFADALERNPTHARARLWLAATLLKAGRRDEAEWEVQELMTLNPKFSLSRLLFAFPLKDPRQRDELTGALARLGLPE